MLGCFSSSSSTSNDGVENIYEKYILLIYNEDLMICVAVTII